MSQPSGSLSPATQLAKQPKSGLEVSGDWCGVGGVERFGPEVPGFYAYPIGVQTC